MFVFIVVTFLASKYSPITQKLHKVGKVGRGEEEACHIMRYTICCLFIRSVLMAGNAAANCACSESFSLKCAIINFKKNCKENTEPQKKTKLKNKKQ